MISRGRFLAVLVVEINAELERGEGRGEEGERALLSDEEERIFILYRIVGGEESSARCYICEPGYKQSVIDYITNLLRLA